MPVAFYLDHHVPQAITVGLRLRGVDVITAYEDASHELADTALLDRATTLSLSTWSQGGAGQPQI